MHRSEFLKASPPMFKSGLLDRFTRVHHLVPVADLPARDRAPRSRLGVGRVGWLGHRRPRARRLRVWTLAEYWIHRVIFHFEPEHGIGARLHWMIHGVHHDHPNDPLRLVMPPAASVPLALIFYARSGSCSARTCAFAVRRRLPRRLPRLRHDPLPPAPPHAADAARQRLRELHMRHHFQDDERGFGISAPYWDRVFGTRCSVAHASGRVVMLSDSWSEDVEVRGRGRRRPARRRRAAACSRRRGPLGPRRARPPRSPRPGFVAGAATVAVVSRRRAQRAPRSARSGGRSARSCRRTRSWSTSTCCARVSVASRPRARCGRRWPFRLGGASLDGLIAPRAATGSSGCCTSTASRSLVGGRPAGARPRAVRGRAARSKRRRARGIARMRFAIGVDDDLRPFHDALPRRPADRPRGARAAVAAGAPPARSRGRRCCGRSPSS